MLCGVAEGCSLMSSAARVLAARWVKMQIQCVKLRNFSRR